MKIFSLKWKNAGKTIYWGEGLLTGNMLIGDYRGR